MDKLSKLLDYNNLFYDLIQNKEEIKSIDDAISLGMTFRREIMIAEVDDTTGDILHNFITFWNDVDKRLNVPVDQREPIKIFIDSPGGDLLAAFTSIDVIKMSKTPVWCINIGAAYSAALIILVAGHKKFAYPHSSFLLHEGSAGAAGSANQFQNFSLFYKRQLEQMKQHILSNTTMTEEDYENVRKDDHWMDAEDALKFGFINEIVDSFD